MTDPGQLVVFCIDDGRYALPLSAVERIVRAVEVTPLPGAPVLVLGIMNVAGQVIPVLDLRQRFALPTRVVDPDDQFIIAHSSRRRVALVVDAAVGVIHPPTGAVVELDTIVPGLDHVHGIAKLDDGLILIHDLERFLSLDDERRLDDALASAATTSDDVLVGGTP